MTEIFLQMVFIFDKLAIVFIVLYIVRIYYLGLLIRNTVFSQLCFKLFRYLVCSKVRYFYVHMFCHLASNISVCVCVE